MMPLEATRGQYHSTKAMIAIDVGRQDGNDSWDPATCFEAKMLNNIGSDWSSLETQECHKAFSHDPKEQTYFPILQSSTMPSCT